MSNQSAVFTASLTNKDFDGVIDVFNGTSYMLLLYIDQVRTP